MYQFKIDHFENEHGAGSFPTYRALSSDGAQQVLTSLRAKLGLPSDLEALDVRDELDRKSVEIKGMDATAEAFNLQSLLHELRYSASTVLVNWYCFDRIDEFQMENLCAIFNDIFYPSADDLDILDSNLTWLISIRHYGAVKALTLSQNDEMPRIATSEPKKTSPKRRLHPLRAANHELWN